MQQLLLGLSRPIRNPTHPEDPTGDRSETGRPDQVTGRRRIIFSKNRLRRVGLGFPLPKPEKSDPTDV